MPEKEVNYENMSDAVHEAVHAVRDAQQAVELARQAQFQELIQGMDVKIAAAVERGFKAGVDEKRYIDVTRIPLICQSIVGIDKKLGELVTRQEFWPVRTLVYGLTALMLSGVVGALLMLILKK